MYSWGLAVGGCGVTWGTLVEQRAWGVTVLGVNGFRRLRRAAWQTSRRRRDILFSVWAPALKPSRNGMTALTWVSLANSQGSCEGVAVATGDFGHGSNWQS